MASVVVSNTANSLKAAKRSRYEKAEVAYGKIAAADYADGDVLVFSHIPSNEVLWFKIVGNGVAVESFVGADHAALTINTNNAGTTVPLSYVCSYIRGNGKIAPGYTPADSAQSRTQGEVIKVTVTA